MANIADKWRDDYLNLKTNPDGIDEWIAWDSAGNEVRCYCDGYTELHIKKPVCDCGADLVRQSQDWWFCPRCHKRYLDGTLISPYVSKYEFEIPDDEDPEFSIVCDYGEYIRVCELGTENCLASYDPNDYDALLLKR